MYKILVHVAFGFLTLTGSLHFAIDVVSQYVRGKRVPGPETTLYYGLNSAYALGQIAFGVLGLLAAREALDLFRRWPAIALTLGVAAAWLAIAGLFLEYREPRITVCLFGALFLAAVVAGLRP
jgi:hypothetical protein